jgi:O-antigen ligase
VPVLMLLAYLASPGFVRKRIYFALHPSQEKALSIRLEMWRVALHMIRAHPWVGVGPNNIVEVYPLYLPPGKSPEVGYHNHFHNDYLQMAAERGLPCLAAWLWLMGALGWYTLKVRRNLRGQRWVADAAFAAWLAMLAEGGFEFNFGSSPVLMMFLLFTALPFAAEQAELPGGEPGASST